VLLAAFDTRRPTKDVDLAGIKLVNSTETVLDLVQTVLRVPVAADDGIEFSRGCYVAKPEWAVESNNQR
jgi:hypothetical protein